MSTEQRKCYRSRGLCIAEENVQLRKQKGRVSPEATDRHSEQRPKRRKKEHSDVDALSIDLQNHYVPGNNDNITLAIEQAVSLFLGDIFYLKRSKWDRFSCFVVLYLTEELYNEVMQASCKLYSSLQSQNPWKELILFSGTRGSFCLLHNNLTNRNIFDNFRTYICKLKENVIYHVSFTEIFKGSHGSHPGDTLNLNQYNKVFSIRKKVVYPKPLNVWTVFPLWGAYSVQESGESDPNPTPHISGIGNSSAIPETAIPVNTGATSEVSRERNPAVVSENAEHANQSYRRRKPPRYPHYINVKDRLRTYTHWSRQQPSSSQLANAGFFFTNSSDLVRCFQCGIGLKDFANSDDPLVEHVKHSGDCEYLGEIIEATELSNLKARLLQQNPDYRRRQQLQELNTPLDGYGVRNYRHPEYKSYEIRLATYVKWPQHLVQRPHQLAEAGLYYTGVDDHVRCFACDGGLRRWDPEDNPWMEHCRWFPACEFARDRKGDEYIALVQASVDAPENTDIEANEATSDIQHEIAGGMAGLTLVNSEYQRVIDEHRITCLDMGFLMSDFNAAVTELRNQGNMRPSIEDVITAIGIVQERSISNKEQPITNTSTETPESLLEENQRLKKRLICNNCHTNEVNALFLPCTHHRLCIHCAAGVTTCPFCSRKIHQTIKTFLV